MGCYFLLLLVTPKISFVVVPTDKAANNVSIICKKYYHQCMQAELMSNVYEAVRTSEDDIIDKHVQELGSHNITIPNDNKKLPFIYSTAKQHKTPVGNRYNVSGKQCTTKKLSKVLLKVFQLVSKTLKYHCQYKCKFLKTKSYWIIDNSDDIHRDIKQLNNKKKASTIYSHDFMKLYTNIPHGMRKDNILYVIEEAFKQALELKYTARSRTNASFLDMDISINNSIFNKKLFDKRNGLTLMSFHFQICQVIYL